MSHHAVRQRTRTCSFGLIRFAMFLWGNVVLRDLASAARIRYPTNVVLGGAVPKEFCLLRGRLRDIPRRRPRRMGYREKPTFTSVTTGVCFTSVVDRSRRYCRYRLLPLIAPFTAGVNGVQLASGTAVSP